MRAAAAAGSRVCACAAWACDALDRFEGWCGGRGDGKVCYARTAAAASEATWAARMRREIDSSFSDALFVALHMIRYYITQGNLKSR